MEQNVVFRTRGLRKEFGPTIALKGVDIALLPGEIRGLVGENGSYTPVAAQTNALMELKAGTIDFAVIDLLMAQAMVGQGDYADLSINTAYTPDAEVYAIGCRKGSDMTAKINEAILKLVENGKLAEIAAKYELSDALIPNIGK